MIDLKKISMKVIYNYKLPKQKIWHIYFPVLPQINHIIDIEGKPYLVRSINHIVQNETQTILILVD